MTAVDTTPRVQAPPFGRFFLPGPTEVRHDVLYAMTQQMIGHRGKAVEDLMARVAPKLQAVFRTSRPVYTSSSSATGLMEAGVRNAARERVLCCINGSFSERFYKASVNSGITSDKLEVPYGQYHTPDMLADALKRGKYDVVTVVHSETSTGVLNPIEELAKVVHAAGDVVLVVDTVSSMAAARIESDAWDLDYVLTGSQKALAMPPGLAFCTANDRVLARAKESNRRGLYFDLLEFDQYYRKNQSPNTPAVSLLYALDACRSTTSSTRESRRDGRDTRPWPNGPGRGCRRCRTRASTRSCTPRRDIARRRSPASRPLPDGPDPSSSPR
jgi:aspartate aminotransferase-like enzyme